MCRANPIRTPSLSGTFYSRGLDFWGVQLQRANELEKAGACFTLAEQINPDNVVAQINLQFNQALREGQSVPLDLSKADNDQFGKYHDWNEVVNANGRFDEPSFCLLEGINLATQNQYYHQAATAFARVVNSSRTICSPGFGWAGFMCFPDCPTARWRYCASLSNSRKNFPSPKQMKPS